MNDRIINTLRQKKVVIWEESARDGAQAKTIMDADDRIKVAKATASIFGDYGVDHVVFAAGFPAICKDEFEVIRKMVDNVDECYICPNGRAMEKEIQLCIDSVKGAKYGRVGVAFPASKVISDIMYHLPLDKAMEKNLDLLKFALDHSEGLPIDVQLVDITLTEPEFLAEYINKYHELGAATICLADTTGKFYPSTVADFFRRLKKNTNPDVSYYTHFHNDLGLALMNNIEVLKQDVFLISTSWLGLGERTGLLATELFLFLMAFEPENLRTRFGINSDNLFFGKPDLRKMYETAQMVSEITGVPLKITDPIVGTGVNTISTGTPFINPLAFQPFDTEKVLGAGQKVYASHLANSRVISKVAENNGFTITKEEINAILNHIKSQAYKIKKAVFEDDEIKEMILKLRKK